MRKTFIAIASTAALMLAASVSAFAQDTSSELLRQIKAMGAAKVEYLYKVKTESKPSVEMTGWAEIQDNMWKDINSDGSEFYCDGASLWYKFSGEVQISKVNPNATDPVHNIQAFIAKSTLTKAANGNKLLSLEQNGTVMTLEIKSMKKIPLKEMSYYIMDTSKLGVDYYVTDLR
jgi:uncharacterized protein YuzE